MTECINKHYFHEVVEPEGNKIIAFVVYNPINCRTNVAYGYFGNKRETHSMLHEFAKDDDFWAKMDENDEPIGGGIWYLRTGDQRPSIHYGDAPQDTWDAVEKFVNKHFDHKVEE